MIPAPMRAQGAALYFLTLNFISGTLGPTSVALFNDRVFGRENIRYSLVVVPAIGMTITLSTASPQGSACLSTNALESIGNAGCATIDS